MGYLSEDSTKSTMRLISVLLIFAGILIAFNAMVIWSIAVIAHVLSPNGENYSTNYPDIAQQIQLAGVLVGSAILGKGGQKIIEKAKNKKVIDENN